MGSFRSSEAGYVYSATGITELYPDNRESPVYTAISTLPYPQAGVYTCCSGYRMLWTIAVVLIILWLLGMVSSYTLGGFIHILLVLAIIVVLIRVIQGRSPV